VSSKFIKKLKKELKKSPGKAAVLALLSLVAIWFWAPLVTNLFGGETKSAPVKATAHTPAIATANAVAGPTLIQSPVDWKQISESIDKDPRMKPADRLVLPRDPFRPIEPEQEKEIHVSAKSEPQPVALDIPPAEAGLVLSGTIVGSRRSVARLNGRNYSKGDFVTASGSNMSLSYRVVDVEGRSVTLALGDRQYELKMPRRSDASGIAGSGLQDNDSSDSPDFDPSFLESLN
jgi:hypothetical protein